jgi:hypothetical protein
LRHAALGQATERGDLVLSALFFGDSSNFSFFEGVPEQAQSLQEDHCAGCCQKIISGADIFL